LDKIPGKAQSNVSKHKNNIIIVSKTNGPINKIKLSQNILKINYHLTIIYYICICMVKWLM